MEDSDIILTDCDFPLLTSEQLKDIASNFSSGNFEAITTKLITMDIISSLKDQPYKLQIILSILIYCLLKRQETERVNILYNTYQIPNNKMIFPLLFLKAKFYSFSSDVPLSVGIYHEMLLRYENYNNKEDKENIITIETYHSKFEIFQNFFNYLYSIDNLDSKIKKIYFELKNSLYSLNFQTDSYELILKLYEKYPDDLVVMFEACKDSLLYSYLDKYKEILEKMKKKRDELKDNNELQKSYDNYISYAESLFLLSKGEYGNAKQSLDSLIEKEGDNIVLLNNEAIMNVFTGNIDNCNEQLRRIADRTKLNSYNIVIKSNLDVLSDMFGYNRYTGGNA